MKYKIDKWPIKQLVNIYEDDRLILSPPYQRNPIWSLKAQKMLIKTIKLDQPIPNFFLLRRNSGDYEMVDGQQRARTIIGYLRGDFPDFDGIMFDQIKDVDRRKFLEYPLSVTIISELTDTDSIESFYALVNSSGLRLNRPELKKAEYFNTNFLRLITTLADYPDFVDLELFPAQSVNRMNNVDFVSELIALMVYGISDKKEKVDELFENDVSDQDYQNLKKRFLQIIGYFKGFDSIYPIKKTRFRQKNDFYSLFALIFQNPQLKDKELNYFYKLLLKISSYIRPSQEDCDAFMNYALNCVTQSNSKRAREHRHMFLMGLLLNESNKPSDIQQDILRFFKMSDSDLVRISSYTTLSIDAIHDPYQGELSF